MVSNLDTSLTMVDDANATSYFAPTSHFASTSTPSSTVTWTKGERIFQVVCLTIIMTVGIVGNGLVILSVIMSRRLRTVTNVYVVNLAVTDLLTVLNIPWTIVALLSDTKGWPLDEWLCVFTAGSLIVCITSSIYTMAMIAISRLIVVTGELRHHRQAVTFKRAWVITALLFIWSISFFAASIPAIFDIGKLGYDSRYSSCTWDSSHPESSTYSAILAALLYPVPFLVITICYLILFLYFHNHTTTMKSNFKSDNGIDVTDGQQTRYVVTNKNRTLERLTRMHIQVTRNLFSVVVVYIICLTPFGVCLLLNTNGSIKATPYAAIVLIVNSCLNPLIYAIKHPHFKHIFKSLLKCDLKRIEDRPQCIRNIRLAIKREKPRTLTTI